MLDLGFFEIILIGIIAIVVVGPEKLPETMGNIFKFFKKMKNFMTETKDSFEKELQIKELKDEANKYKQDLMSASQKLEEMTNNEINNPINNEIAKMKSIEIKENITLTKSSAKSELDSILKSNQNV